MSKGVDFLKGTVDAAREANKVAAVTANTIQTTGGAANVTAGQVNGLADAIARKTGIDRVNIATSENVLLTFQNVRNEVGKNNDIFNQATKAATDLSKSPIFGGDSATAARVLGKALNDPQQGLLALSRIGVQFTAQQKDQIKTLTDSGHALQAQQVILGVVNQKFGGTAAAQATAADKLKVTITGIKENIGNVLIPVIDRVATFVADKLPGALSALGRGFDRLKTALAPTFNQIRLFFNTLRTGLTGNEASPIEKFALKVRDFYEKALKPTFAFLRDNVKPILVAAGIAFGLFAGPIIGPIALIATLAARFQIVRDVIRDVVGYVVTQLRTFSDAFSSRFAAIQEAVGHVMIAIRDVIVVTLAPILLIWAVWGDQIRAIVGIVFDQIKLIIDTAVRIIRDIIDVVLNVINGNWGAAWNALKDIPAAILTYVVGTIEHILGVMKQIVSGGIDAVVGFFRELPGRLVALAGTIGSAALGIGKAIIDGIGKGLSAAVGFAGDVASSVLRAIKNVINTQIIDRINNGIPDSIGAGPFRVDLPKNPIPRLAAGAIVDPRPGGVLANIAEGGRAEGVFPLPPGVLEGLQAIAANYKNGRTGDGGPLVGQIVFEGAVTADAAETNAAALIRRLRAEAWVQGK